MEDLILWFQDYSMRRRARIERRQERRLIHIETKLHSFCVILIDHRFFVFDHQTHGSINQNQNTTLPQRASFVIRL